jgi:hypothetical protein
LEKDSRSNARIVHSEVGVKSWLEAPPSCDAARPACCPACGAASREPGRPLRIVGHGFRVRSIEGPHAPGEAPVVTEIRARRYDCRGCGAILVVMPRGIGRGYRYALTAIAFALGLWAGGTPGPTVRSMVSAAKRIGASSAARWASLRRWVLAAVALFGAAVSAVGSPRERAARVAAFVASNSPIAAGPVALGAFAGASFCASG